MTVHKTAKTRRLPPWLKVSLRGARPREDVRTLLQDLSLNTVCESAGCPNLCECWGRRTATFMILGDVCTRNCGFCAVAHGQPLPPDPDEPRRVAEAVRRLGLRYAVLTSVTRDDLSDAGASHFAATMVAIQRHEPHVGIEVLTPDFGGLEAPIAGVLECRPAVFNHNLETCRRLTGSVRCGADYDRSLAVLRFAAGHRAAPMVVKSGFMLGLGETETEVMELLADLRHRGVESLTIGQYLQPSPRHLPVIEYVTPDAFAAWGVTARREFGFSHVASAPLVRSSYFADGALLKKQLAVAIRGTVS